MASSPSICPRSSSATAKWLSLCVSTPTAIIVSSASLVDLGGVEAAGQSCVERCQASMKSRQHPWTGGGRQISAKAQTASQIESHPAAAHNLPGTPDSTTPVLCCTRPTGSLRDRKSTRLNSSHLGISYAVFCLDRKST